MKRILIVTAVEAEREAIARSLNEQTNIEVIAAGVGSAAAAAYTAQALSARNIDLVISAGIGGAFPQRVEVGGVVLADQIVAADLGSESQEGFLSVERTGLGSNLIHVDSKLTRSLAEALKEQKIPFAVGSIVTVNTTTGTKKTADELAARVPHACAEGMEGFGVATAAKLYGVPCLEVRTISNEVGPRDRDNWRIVEALEQLTNVSSIIQEVYR